MSANLGIGGKNTRASFADRLAGGRTNALQSLQEGKSQKRSRLHALWLLRKGHSLRQTARLIRVHDRTLQDWVASYRRRGLDEVLRHHRGGHGGRQSRLSPQEEARLKVLAGQGAVRTIWDGVVWARSACGLVETYWGMRRMFARLKLKKKGPRPMAPRRLCKRRRSGKRGLAAKLSPPTASRRKRVSRL